MNSARDWVGLMLVTGSAKFADERKAVESVERTYYSILVEVDKFLCHCPKCGKALEGRVASFQPEHKYCGQCKMFPLNFFAGSIGLPDNFII